MFILCYRIFIYIEMKKWQIRQRQKAHDHIVDNAKSTIRRYSHNKDTAMSSSRSKNTSTTHLPVNKILEIFELEQYAFLLSEYGFPYKLTHKNSRDYIQEMMLKVDEHDQERFLSLLNTLTIMSKDIKKSEKTPNVIRSKKSTNFPPSVSTSKHSPPSLQKSEKTSSKFRIKNSGSLHRNQRDDSIRIKVKRPPKFQRQRTIPHKYNRKKSISHMRSPAHDDFTVIHDFKNSQAGEIRSTMLNNHLIKRLADKLQAIGDKTEKNIEDIQLNMQTIKEMYKSYDSAKITSNITNIDLQLMIDCLSHEIYEEIQRSSLKQFTKDNQQKIKLLLKESFLQCKEFKLEEEANEKDYRSEEIHLIDRKKFIEDEVGSQIQEVKAEEQLSRSNHFEEEEIDTDKSQGGCSIEMAEMLQNKSSSIWGNSFIESVINDFSCFDQRAASETKVQRQDIKNFIELVVMAGKMEKQIPIIAHVYLKRLMKMTKNQGGRVTEKNWKNITLITLIQGSKMWDDQSLENHSFSKIVKPYTTLEINRLEKYLLFFIDYKITINQKQYSESYFQLRNHANQSKCTANLMKLDLRTIQRLQDSSKKVNHTKQQFLKKCMNKSF